jgi:DNA-binding FadR family transcriptional regulator
MQPMNKSDTTTKSNYEYIAERLRTAILSQELLPGSKLPNENELSEKFRVSRATVREALRGLAAENLIITRQGTAGGSFVSEPSIGQLSRRLQGGLSRLTSSAGISLENFMEMRGFLEVPAAALAAERRTGDDLELLEQTLPSPRLSIPDQERYHSNRDFHFVIIDICHNPLLRLASEPVFFVLQTCLDRARLPESFHGTVTRQHRGIANAIRAKNGDLALQLMQDHLSWLEPRYRRVWQVP